MKRSPLKRKTPLTSSKPMRRVSKSRAAKRASKEGQEALSYMRAVKQLPCAVSGKPPPNDAHHCICGRYGSRKSSDFDVIPLAPEFHRHPYPDAIHTNKRAWIEKHGNDHEYIKQTRAAVRAGGEGANDAEGF